MPTITEKAAIMNTAQHFAPHAMTTLKTTITSYHARNARAEKDYKKNI
jgi:hypothetical protein